MGPPLPDAPQRARASNSEGGLPINEVLTTIVLGCGPKGWRKDALNVDAQHYTVEIPNFLLWNFARDGVPACEDPPGWQLVVMEDVIEHLQRADIDRVLDVIHGRLRAGGQLEIKCPNLETIIAEYLAQRIDGAELARLLYGEQHGAIFDCHLWGFTPRTLLACLKAHNFFPLRHEVRVKDDLGRFNNQRLVVGK